MPDSFDARLHWANCADVISRIGDQKSCNSGWAFSVAHAISDRICIASEGKVKPWISAQDLMECSLGKEVTIRNKKYIIGDACAGGSDVAAWQHYIKKGVVTGSTDGGSLGCKPYLFACTQIENRTFCPDVQNIKLSCESDCENAYYKYGIYPNEKEKYQSDLHFGRNYQQLNIGPDAAQLAQIKQIIYKDGPVTAGIDGSVIQVSTIDNDEGIFLKKGEKGTHFVRIIGWGKSDKYGNYWIIVNSKGNAWNKDGTMKVAFGAAAMNGKIAFALPKL